MVNNNKNMRNINLLCPDMHTNTLYFHTCLLFKYAYHF
jgi:hypothetical protein